MVPFRRISPRARLALAALALWQLAGCKLTPKDLRAATLGQCVLKAAVAPSPRVERSCDDATLGPVVETIFDKDVADGQRTEIVETELGPATVKVLTFNTSAQFLADPEEYEAAYEDDEFSVALKLPGGESIGGKGRSLDDAIANAYSRCREGTR